MNGKSLVTLVLAIVFGLAAMLLTKRMLGPGEVKKEEETQEVLIAVRDIKEEETLKADMVKVVRMVKSAVPAGAFSAAKDVEERWVKTAMLEGDVLIEKKLGPKGTPPGLVANIPKGMRAFAIDVTEQSSVSGFILPGHHVDVVKFDSTDPKHERGETILQDVLVLAAGQVFTRPEERALQTRTVTLALAPEDVHVIVAARARGTLSLALRGVNDHAIVVKAKPKIDPEQEARFKLESEKRQRLERELADLKVALARQTEQKKAAERPRPKPRSAPTVKYAAVYRGLGNMARISLVQPARTELAPDTVVAVDKPSAPPPGTLAPTAELDVEEDGSGLDEEGP
jgi:pilus assembly protein CpaB